MTRMMAGFVGVTVLLIGSVALAQMGGGMMGDESYGRYGMAGGYMAWWGVFGLVRVVVVVVGLWLLLRIARAVETIAGSK